MRYIPFTVHVRLVPEAPGKRFEYIRSLQKWSHMLYEELASVATLNVADPGGGQHMGFSGGGAGGNSGIVKGCAVKPQIGESPAQLMITGFYESAAQNTQPHPSVMRISGGSTYTGNVAHSETANPSAWVNTGVSEVKALVESAISAAVPVAIAAKVFRIEFAGVTYGDKGYHFPL
jgi:hypothetical protein